MDHQSLNDIVFAYSEREHSYWPAKVIDVSQAAFKVKLYVLNQYELVKPNEIFSFQSKQLDKLKFQSSKRFLTALKLATKEFQQFHSQKSFQVKSIKVKFRDREEIVYSSMQRSKLEESFSTSKSQKSVSDLSSDGDGLTPINQLEVLYHQDPENIIKFAQINSKYQIFLTDPKDKSTLKKSYQPKILLLKLINYYIQDLTESKIKINAKKLLLKSYTILNYFITIKSKNLDFSKVLKRTQIMLKILKKSNKNNKTNKNIKIQQQIKQLQNLIKDYITQQQQRFLHNKVFEHRIRQQLERRSLLH